MAQALRFFRRAFWVGVASLACVSLAGCHKKKAAPTDTTSVDQPHPPDAVPGAAPIATLERTGCYGECPVYRLTVNSDGSVVYVGTRWVKVLGRQEYRLTEAQLAELDAAFDRANFLRLRDYDRVENTDDDWDHVSYRRGPVVKRVRHYHGDNSAPAALGALEDDFDRIVDSARFVGTATASASPLPAAPATTEPAPSASAGKPSVAPHANDNAGPPDETAADPDNHP